MLCGIPMICLKKAQGMFTWWWGSGRGLCTERITPSLLCLKSHCKGMVFLWNSNSFGLWRLTIYCLISWLLRRRSRRGWGVLWWCWSIGWIFCVGRLPRRWRSYGMCAEYSSWPVAYVEGSWEWHGDSGDDGWGVWADRGGGYFVDVVPRGWLCELLQFCSYIFWPRWGGKSKKD